jgi:colanic acid/amylovoran biosynthesis glycosyltransferase
MRIAFFVQTFPSLSETFILNQVTGLLDRGHEVVVYSEKRPTSMLTHADFAEYGLRDRTRYLDVTKEDGPSAADLLAGARLAVRTPGALSALRRGTAASFGGQQRLLRLLGRLGADDGFDVLHAHFGDVALRSRFARFRWPVPFVASFYGFDCSAFPALHGDDVYEPLFAAADGVTVLSGPMRQRVRRLGCPDDLIREHHIGVDLEAFSFRERGADTEGRAVRLLTVARLVEKKGVEYGLRAVAAMQDKNLHYTVLGDGPLRAALGALAESLGIANRVDFRGAADQQAVRGEMDAADLFVLPSVTASNGDQEGTPTVLMEAGAAGVPVISTLHAGIPEVVLDGCTGRLVVEGDATALAEALRELLEAPGRWAPMGHAARDHIAKHYNARRLVGELEGLYRDLLTSGRKEKES